MSDDMLLLEAAASGQLQVLERLHGERGANLNAQHKMNGFTPLMWAVRREHAPIVDFLLRHLTAEQVTSTRNAQGATAVDFVSTPAIRDLFADRGMVVPEEQLAKRARGDDYVPNYIRYPVITPELKAAGERAGGGGSSAGGFGSVGGFGGRQFMH